MGRRFAFDVSKAIPAAWEFCWAHNVKGRAKEKPSSYNYSRYFYLTAADIENQVRSFAEATAQDKPWSEASVAYGRPWSRIRISGNLQSAVRSWLLGQVQRGILQSHNFKRGHISGMRFRPAGEALSEAEQKTFATKERHAADRAAGKLPPVHFSKGGFGGQPLCTAERRSPFGRTNYRIRSSSEKAKVTCVRCLNKLKQPTENAA